MVGRVLIEGVQPIGRTEHVIDRAPRRGHRERCRRMDTSGVFLIRKDW